MINTGVALWTTVLLAESLGARRWLQGIAVAVMLTLGCGWIWADRILDMGETNLYADDVVLGEDDAVSADRVDRVEGRSAPVPELAPPVQLEEMNTGTTKRSCIPGCPRFQARAASSCSAAATASRCARF